jgi:hypothetical protein
MPQFMYLPWMSGFNRRLVCEICGAPSDIGTDFLLPPLIPPMLHTHLSSRLGTVGPSEATGPGNPVVPFLQLYLTMQAVSACKF